MEWDPPSCKRCQGIDTYVSVCRGRYVGTHRLTGDVQGGCVRNRCLHTYTSYLHVPIVLERLRQQLSSHLLRLRSK